VAPLPARLQFLIMPVNPFADLDLNRCPLCGSADPLRESHIIPRFVLDWLLRSSPTGVMRFGTNPNVRVKDGMKLRLLCDDCEGQLSVWEKSTAEQLFLPYHNDTSVRVRYESWLAKFCASVAWRVLFIYSHTGPLRHLTKTQAERVNMALTTWKNLMFDNAENPGAFELHILPIGILARVEGLNVPPNMNRYLARAVEIDVASSPSTAFVYAKMCKLILLGFIEPPRFRRWHGSRVAMKQGTIEPRNFVVPSAFAEFLAERARRMAKMTSGISAKQKAKTNAAMQSDPDRAANSDGFAAMLKDVAMFGKSAFHSDK
jgi:hypothetical protein